MTKRSRLIRDLLYGFFKQRTLHIHKMTDETVIRTGPLPENYDSARVASQPIRARDFTRSSLCSLRPFRPHSSEKDAEYQNNHWIVESERTRFCVLTVQDWKYNMDVYIICISSLTGYKQETFAINTQQIYIFIINNCLAVLTEHLGYITLNFGAH